MTEERRWHISTDNFVGAVSSISSTAQFEVDETVFTWQVSYFRFVRAKLEAFGSLVDFAAMAVATTPNPGRPVADWAREVVMTPIMPDRQHAMIEAARNDCRLKDEGDRVAPDWLKFDGDIVDAFRFCERGGPLCDIAQHEVYRTAKSYYYLCLNQES